VRSFRVLPAAGDRGAQLTLAIAACASQFGPIFGHLVALRPDLFIWQGDLNYPDTVGPLAQTLSGYAGIWRDFLVNPVLAPLLETTGFVAQRDDHDYAVQDANAAIIPPWGIAPWDGLMSGRRRFRFRTGPIEVWVLDQRREKSDPTAPDTPAKTLLGPVQRRWLLRSLATSDAPVKVICSPCTVFMRFNARDGNWSAGFTAERDLLLAHIRDHVSGRVVFVTGDTHLTGVYDHANQLEVRACPLDIPTPNDVTLVDPNAAAALRKKPGVTYASDLGHFAVVRVDGEQVELSMVREDGATPWRQVVA
jgi:phosphodiesterase/alkaline phosphatase D-like protein